MPPNVLFKRLFLRFISALAALVFVYALVSVAGRCLVRPAVSDFRVIYCGERAVVRAHADPYRVEPLRSCEHATGLEPNEPTWSVTPFPLPSYTAAALAPLAYLPYDVARTAWIVLLAASFGLAAMAVATILEVSGFAVGLVFAPTLGILNLQFGEPVLISVAALCLAALAVHKRRPKLAALAAAAAMIEPHVGLPAALGLFVFVPAARGTLGLAAAVLAAAGVLTLGPAINLEYARDFLSAQARAELLAQDQFSLSRLLYVLGAAPGTAMLLGSLSYACTTLFGLWIAMLLVRRSLTTALYVLVPVATAMLGGPFVHDVQVAAALPAALVLARRYPLARAAVVLLALDWSTHLTHFVIPVVVAAAGTSGVIWPVATPARRGIYVFGSALALLPLALALLFLPPPTFMPAPHSAPPIAASDLAAIPWGWRIELDPSWSQSGLAPTLLKFPTWVALLLIPASLLTLRKRRCSAADFRPERRLRIN